jgi:hypothetical protein
MKFGAFQRLQGEVEQNVKPWSPRSTSDLVDPIGRSPCQVGLAGRLAGPLPSRPAPICSQQGQVLPGNISPYGGKKESEATRMVCANDPADRPQVASSRPLCSTTSSSTPLLMPCKHTPHMSRMPPCKGFSFIA